MMPPLFSSAGRCWMSAFTGTAKNPAQNPSRPSKTAGADQLTVHGTESNAGARHADGPEGDESVLDFVIAEPAGGDAADSDADGEGRVQVAGFGLAHVQNVRTVDDNGREEERSQKPEVRIAEHRHEKRPIAAP